MSEPDGKQPDERESTTVTTRVWCSRMIASAAEMIALDPSLLPANLIELAKTYGPRTGGYPIWLVMGLAAQHLLLTLEREKALRSMPSKGPRP